MYAAREFERFRRDFYVAIVSDYLDLVLRLRLIINAERGVELNRQVEARETAMVQAGRQDAFQADQARTRNPLCAGRPCPTARSLPLGS